MARPRDIDELKKEVVRSAHLLGEIDDEAAILLVADARCRQSSATAEEITAVASEFRKFQVYAVIFEQFLTGKLHAALDGAGNVTFGMPPKAHETPSASQPPESPLTPEDRKLVWRAIVRTYEEKDTLDDVSNELASRIGRLRTEGHLDAHAVECLANWTSSLLDSWANRRPEDSASVLDGASAEYVSHIDRLQAEGHLDVDAVETLGGITEWMASLQASLEHRQ